MRKKERLIKGWWDRTSVQLSTLTRGRFQLVLHVYTIRCEAGFVKCLSEVFGSQTSAKVFLREERGCLTCMQTNGTVLRQACSPECQRSNRSHVGNVKPNNNNNNNNQSTLNIWNHCGKSFLCINASFSLCKWCMSLNQLTNKCIMNAKQHKQFLVITLVMGRRTWKWALALSLDGLMWLWLEVSNSQVKWRTIRASINCVICLWFCVSNFFCK